MNNLAFSTAIISGACIAWFAQERQISSFEKTEATTIAQIQHWKKEGAQFREENARVDAALAEEEVLLKANLDAPQTNAPLEEAPGLWSSLNPETEGAWPSGEPYFYFPKTKIIGLKYTSGASDVTSTLFALNANEKSAVEAAQEQMNEDLRVAQKSRAVPTAVPEMLASYKGEKRSVFVPKLAFEEIEAIKDHLTKSLVAGVGEERGDMLAAILGDAYDSGPFGIKVDRVITLIREGKKSKVLVSAGKGFGTMFNSENGEAMPPEYAQFFPEAN